MHGIPEGKRKVINRDNIIQQVILGGIVIACFIYSFFTGNPILKLGLISIPNFCLGVIGEGEKIVICF